MIFVTIIIYILVFALLYWLIGILPLPAPLAIVKTIMYIILVLAAIVVLLRLIGVHI